jgi:hypothetical protein
MTHIELNRQIRRLKQDIKLSNMHRDFNRVNKLTIELAKLESTLS